jgi:hypothetical protein
MFHHPTIPYDMVADPTASLAFLGFTAVSFAGVLVWASLHFTRTRDKLPFVLMLGGALCGFQEPVGDILGATFYPLNTPLLVFDAFGRHIPLYVFVGESMFFASALYIAYRFLAIGMPARKLLGVIAAFSAFDALMEMTCIHFHVMTYYGNNPVLVLGLPLYSIVQNGALAVVGGWILLALVPRLSGRRVWWLALIIPFGFGLQAWLTTWPMYLGLNSGFSQATMLALGLTATALNIALPFWCIYSPLARRYREQVLHAHSKSAMTQAPAAAH